ncbi:MAG TPA: iron dependent repressor, metal binding and dimerization domain protein [Oscillospiraceae bacterium]|nr:iron dependent repressor, metal binding and dimerization domain protein [Oscillospiraceae bacterium]
MGKPGEFYTMKGYQVNAPGELTPAMEDYLEMICRLLGQKEVVRIGELAERLHVRPSSTSKMIGLLKSAGYVDSEKYGYILLTEKGREAGNYLLYRHEVLRRFLCALNHTEDELEQVEKIEHFLDRSTVENLSALTARLERGDRP